MSKELFTNTPIGFLNGNITSSATSATLVDSTMFPSTGNFTIMIGAEIILVTANASNVLTITRAQEGTAGAAHTSGNVVAGIITAGSLQRLAIQSHGGTIVSARRQLNFIDGGGVAWTLTDDGTNNKVDVSATAASGIEEPWTAPPLVSTLTWVNQSSATATDDAKGFFLSAPSGGSNTWASIGAAPPTGGVAWTFTTRLMGLQNNVSASGAFGVFLCQGNSSSPGIRFGFTGSNIYVVKDTDIKGSFSGSYVNVATDVTVAPFTWLRVVNDLTNLTWSASIDGKYWYQVAQHAVADYLSGIATVAIFCQFGGSGFNNGVRVLSWTMTSP